MDTMPAALCELNENTFQSTVCQIARKV